jgi:hypothetical protein
MRLLRISPCVIMSFLFSMSLKAQFEMRNDDYVPHIATSSVYYGNGISMYDFNYDFEDNLTISYPFEGIKGYSFGLDSLILEFELSLNANIKQIIWADFDNDGDAELFVTAYESGLFLYEYNNGDLVLVDNVLAEYSFGFHYGASLADFDNDGDLDIYVAQHWNSSWGPAYPNLLFRNEGNLQFSEIAAEKGVDAATNNGFQPIWVDFNFDGWQDLYVVHDKNVPNLFYQNIQGEYFVNIAAENNSDLAISSMSNAVCDFNHDSYFDILVTDGGSPKLLRGTANETFNEVAFEVGFLPLITGWGALWIDDDNDGWDDVHICQGGTTDTPIENHYYKNLEGSFFQQNSFDVEVKASFVNAKGDFNNDGSADFVVMNGYPNSYDFWQGLNSGNHFMKLGLQGTESNRNAAGTIVDVYANNIMNRKVLTLGDNYISQNSSYLLFGLGKDTTIDSVVVHWPRGLTEKYFDLSADTFLLFIEGNTMSVSLDTVFLFQNFCANATDSLVFLGDEWLEWEWQNESEGQGLVIFSDTVVWAQALNIDGLWYIVQLNADWVDDWPSYSVVEAACPDDVALLHWNNQGDWYLYNQDNIYTEGDVMLNSGVNDIVFFNNIGCAVNQTLIVEENENWIDSIEVGVACPFSPVHYNIQLSQGQSSTELILLGIDDWTGNLMDGTYPFSIMNMQGCIVQDTISIPEAEIPEMDMVYDTICFNHWAPVEFEGNTFGYDLLDESFSFVPPGQYFFTFINDNECIHELEVVIFESPELSCTETVEIDEQGFASIHLQIEGGMPPYQIFWQEEIADEHWTGILEDSISYQVIDDLGCQISGFVGAPMENDIKDNAKHPLYFRNNHLFCPNCIDHSFTLFDALGKMVYRDNFANDVIDLSFLGDGFYLFVSGSYSMKILIQN